MGSNPNYKLTCGQHPDHNTITAFVSKMQKDIRPLFHEIASIINLQLSAFQAATKCKKAESVLTPLFNMSIGAIARSFVILT
jgi:hypothetical protein